MLAQLKDMELPLKHRGSCCGCVGSVSEGSLMILDTHESTTHTRTETHRLNLPRPPAHPPPQVYLDKGQGALV